MITGRSGHLVVQRSLLAGQLLQLLVYPGDRLASRSDVSSTGLVCPILSSASLASSRLARYYDLVGSR